MTAPPANAAKLRGGGGRASVPWYLFLPAMLPIALFSVLPLLQGIYLGFTEYRLGQDAPTFNGLANFAKMFQDKQFLSSFQVGLIWTFAVTAGVLFFGMGLALLLNARLPLQGLARVLVLVPWAIPPVIKGLIWRMVYHPDAGFLNQGLASVGFTDLRLNVLTDFTWALPAVIVVGIWAGLQSIPDELKEAAALDGAGPWGVLRNVTLPLMMPVIAATAALEFMWNFNAFGLVYVLTEGGPAGTTRLPMLFAYEEAFQYGNIGYASSLGLAMVVVVGVLVYYTVRRQAQGGDA